ncbi:protein required for normal CLN1 and CLN2 G1 cyclin expression [Spiromyces aspiralis]|uniref:Protein required for normal CLN1 and CLN2 G1 cyclin expression n=1 Tax=Spiromyces aspiralis TaxID=68401 RepID=A0ACC1HTM1_9FUNG|nr:protein required for normal CLN1 and CLN2 G1 cyclin expression [Spiromyces aspiralis]
MEATSSRIIEVPLYGTDNVLEIDCNELPEQAQEICDILFQEKSPPKFYLQFALEYFRQNKIDESIVALKKGLSSDVAMNNQAKLPLVNCLASMYINKAKASPIPPAVADQADGRPHGTAANGHGSTATTANDRDKYFELAYALLDESGRMDPSHPTTLLCKGLLLLAKRQFDQAGPLFDRILGQNSNDVAALLGKASILARAVVVALTPTSP